MKSRGISVTESLNENCEYNSKNFEEAQTGLARIGGDFRFIELNDAFCRILGYTKEELSCLTIQDITYPDHIEADNRELKRLLAGEKIVCKAAKGFVCKDNNIIWAHALISIVRNEKGRFLHFLLLIDEIPGKLQYEQIQQKTKKQHQGESSDIFSTTGKCVINVAVTIFIMEMLTAVLYSKISSASNFRNIIIYGVFQLFILFLILYFFLYRLIILYRTRRKKEEGELLKFMLGIECLNESIFITDPAGTISYVNPAFEKTYGYRKEEVIGRIPKDFISNHGLDEACEDFRLILQSKKAVYQEDKITTKDGRIIAVKSLVNPIFDKSGKINGLITIQRDISTQKWTKQLRKVLVNISSAILTSKNVDELTEIIREQIGTLINAKNFNIIFYDKGTGLLTATYNKDDNEKIRSWPIGKSLTGHVIRNKKPLLLTKDVILELHRQKKIDLIGPMAEVWLGVPILGYKEVIGAFIVQSYTDPNEYDLKDMEKLEFIANQIAVSIQHKKIMLDLEAALSRAEESDRLKSAFLSTISHELRTPLHQIMGFSELILSGADQEETLDYASVIQSSGRNLLSIIEDIFDLILVEQVHIKLRKQTFNLMDHFRDKKKSFENILQTSAKDEQIELVFKPDAKLPFCHIVSDPNKINKVLDNLFKNAVKFTQKGIIEFGSEIIDESTLMFYIRDTGIGIPKEKQSIIFDLFRQGDDSFSRSYGGLGIGLPISMKIASVLKGELTFESEPGKGSTFCLFIPVEFSNKDGLKTSIRSELADNLNLEGKNILIVEDDPLSHVILKKFLKVTGAGILGAVGGNEAIRMCSEHPEIDLVLMDLKMAGMDGIDTTRLIKAEKPQLIIIAITAYSRNLDKQRVFEAGCSAILTKPISKGRLYGEIKNFLYSV
jgi:PAS domain S-box-containing protein